MLYSTLLFLPFCMDFGIAETGIARGSPPGTTTEVLRFGIPFAEIRVVSVLVDHNLAIECPWGIPTIPKVLWESVEQIGRSGVGFEGVDPRALFIQSCPCVTGLTGARPCWVLSWGTVAFVWLCHVVLLVSSWFVWSWFARFCEWFSFIPGCALVVVFVPRPKGVTEASWNVVVYLLFANDLTDRVHRSDWCHRSDQQWPAVWPAWYRR
jgi:hypothetical protein